MGQHLGPLRPHQIAEAVMSRVSNLPTLHTNQGRLKTDLMVITDHEGYPTITW